MERRASELLSSTSTTRERLYTASARLHLPHSCIMPPAIRMSATLSFTSKSIPANGLDQRIGLGSYSQHQDIHTQLSDCSNNLSFSSRVCHRLSFLYRLFPPQYTYIYAPPTRSSIPCFSTSVYPTRTELRRYMVAFHSSRAFSHACAPGNVTRLHAILATHLSRRKSAKRRKERHKGAYF